MSQNFWDKVQRSRITRRRMLGGTVALSAGIGAMAVVGCSKSSSNKGGTTPSSTGGATAEATAKQSSAVTSRGGIYRSFTFDALSLDTFDPHQTQFGPMYNMHSAVFSKVLKYDDEVTQQLSADLADGLPAQPDKTTYIFKLRKGVKFHDSPRFRANLPTVAGRELTAEDVKYSIERQINPSSSQKALYYRRG